VLDGAHVAARGVEGFGDRRMAQAVRADRLVGRLAQRGNERPYTRARQAAGSLPGAVNVGEERSTMLAL
jgi:hypothetical protein